MWHDQPRSSKIDKETRQQKEQWGWSLEATGKGWLDKICKKGRCRQYGGGLHKIGTLGTLTLSYHDIHKKYEKTTKHITLSNLI